MTKIQELQQQIDQIDAQIDAIKFELVKIGPMRPGTLTRQYQRPKEKKVPYWQLSYTHRQKSYSDYIRDSLYEAILPQTQAYQQFTSLIQRWTDLTIERGRISLKLMRDTAPRRATQKRTRATRKP